MSSENFQDFEFIIQRVTWARSLTVEKLMEHIGQHPMDAFHTIPNPLNGHTLIVGAEVTERFRKIAKCHLASHPAKKARTDLGSFVKQLGVKFSEFFLGTERAMDQGNMDRWIASAYRATAKEHAAATHYIPCALIFSKTAQQFAIGPVTFYHASEFYRLFGQEIEGLRDKIRDRHRQRVEEAIKKGFPEKNAATPEQSAQWGNHLTDGLLDFYKGFNWFAVVQVPASGQEVSYDRALFVTRGALNIIKLLLGAAYTDRLRTADDPGNTGPSATLTRTEQGELDISLTSTPIDNTAGDQWVEYLTKSCGRFYERACRLLSLCFAFETAPPLCARLMDALHWFGEAVTEKTRAGRIVKFVTAIERVCGTGIEKNDAGEDRGVTDIVTTRAAVLYSVLEEIPFDQARDKIVRIYETRSDLVHGSVSPFDESVAEQLRNTYEVTRAVLLAALDYYSTIGLEDTKNTERGLRIHFQKLEKWNADGRPV